jgi:hypothetical protein
MERLLFFPWEDVKMLTFPWKKMNKSWEFDEKLPPNHPRHG